jgi:hypothetical protein
MGVRNAASLTKEEASQRIDTLFQIDDLDERERMRARQGDWITDRFILHPDLYGPEFQRYLDEELPELLHAYVRGRVAGAAERLTKPKIREVVHALTRDDREWWRQPTRRELFFERLRQMYPACCEGREPARSPRPRKATARATVPASQGSGCLVLVVTPILVFVAYALIRMWT